MGKTQQIHPTVKSLEGILQDENGTIGIMIIPKINVKVPINEGAELDTLKYAVGHFKGTAMPGSKEISVWQATETVLIINILMI